VVDFQKIIAICIAI